MRWRRTARSVTGQQDQAKLGRKLWRGSLILVVVIAAAFLKVGIQLNSNTHHIEHQQSTISRTVTTQGHQQKALSQLFATLRAGSLASCHRVNLERAKSNRNQLHDFRLYSLTITLLGAAIDHPTQPTTPEERQAGERYLRAIRSAVLAKEWTPLTRCELAIDHPLTYKSPPSFAFKKRLPPHNALYVGRGN